MQNQDLILLTKVKIKFDFVCGDLRDMGHNVMTKAGSFYTF